MAEPGHELVLPVTCHSCGGNLVLLHSTAHHGTRAMGVVECVDCPAHWSIEVLLRRLPRGA